MEKDLIEELMGIYIKACVGAAIKSIAEAADVAEFEMDNIIQGGSFKVQKTGEKFHYKITITKCDCGEE